MREQSSHFFHLQIGTEFPCRRVSYCDMMENQPTEPMKDLIPSSDELAERIAPYGDTSKGIRKSKPDDNGLVQYVWRMSRFFSGDDMHMPVTAYWWLQDWIDEQGIDASVSGIHDEKGKEIMNELNDVIGRVLREEFGMDDTRAARRWSKAGLF